MFVTSDKNSSPRVFQKPNILRKKPKAKEKPAAAAEAPAPPESAATCRHHGGKPCQAACKPCHAACKPPQRIRLDSYICEEYRMKKLLGGGEAAPEPAPAPARPPVSHSLSAPQMVYEETDIIYASGLFQGKYKVELGDEYLQNDASEMAAEGDRVSGGGEGGGGDGDFAEQWELAPFISIDSLNTWSIQLRPSAKERLASPFSCGREQAGAVLEGAGGKGAEPLVIRLEDVSRLTGSLHAQHRPAPHKCDHEGCNKTFASTDSLARHRASHARRAAAERAPATPPRQLTLDCPARRLDRDPPACDAVFQCREDLARHLSEDHTDEEAPYKCDKCGRVFFWCSGLRAHMRAHERSTRMLFACLWPGCSRVFLQACRLKEHSRAHTGDKPYACLYPNCGWAFCTASKLMRHRRRHTDERRFPCELCGRAFLRPEHLREHAMRHTHPLYRHKHLCTVPGCEQKFTNKSSLYLHMKKVHPPPAPSPPPALPVPTIDFEVMSSPLPEEFRAARTHVTWPLPPGAHRDSPVSDDDALDTDSQREGGVYTVRSDLFLHGNTALHHDDTQQCLELVLLGGVGGGDEEERGGGYVDSLHLDTDLDLLDSAADPINHLLQEELMLAGAGVDESPFQVLLLSEEEVH